MNFRSFFSVIVSLLAIASAHLAQAGSVGWGAVADNGLADVTGTKLLPGDLLLLGSFNIPESTIQANSGNIAFLMSHFTTYGTSTIGNNVGGAPGFFFQNTVGNFDTTTPFPLGGLKIYLWAFNTPTATIATQQGLFSLNGNTSWLFPHDSDVITTTNIDLTDLTNGPGTALVANADIVIGGFKQGVGNTLDFNLALIPEPSTYALGIVGGLGLLLARRRNAKSRS